jgi:nicotinate-nucleotide adenylyltransferase
MAGAIGLLTGTFDPIHLGHVALAEAACRAVGLAEVWLVINPDPEHKLGVTPLSDRIAMAHLAVAGHPSIHVYEGPLSRQPHGVGLFRELMRELGAPAYVFILGQDTLSRLDSWDDSQSVVNLAPYAVASRPGASHDSERALRARLGDLAKALQVQWFELASDQGAASRAMREQLQRGTVPAGLDPRVAHYIHDHGLYQ